MFTKEVILEILKDEDVKCVPMAYQTIMIRAIERILDKIDYYKQINIDK